MKAAKWAAAKRARRNGSGEMKAAKRFKTLIFSKTRMTEFKSVFWKKKVFFGKTLFSFVMQQKLAPGAELTVQGADGSRALKGLTHHKLAPGAEQTVRRSLRFKGAEGFNSPDGAEVFKLALTQRQARS